MAQTYARGPIGQSTLRVEDDPLLKGLGAFVDDVAPPKNTLHLGFVRSPHAHARICSIDTSAAKRLPGVVDVLTGRDLVDLMKPIQVDPDKPGFKITHRLAVTIDKARFVGDTVAVVVAENPYIADDAVEAVAVEYEALPAVVSLDASLAPGAPKIHDYIADNVIYENEQKTEGFDAVFTAAPHKFVRTFRTSRIAVASMEARGCIAIFERGLGTLTFWTSTQVPHIVRHALSEMLGLSDSKIRVIAPDVGGGFGMKAYLYPEELVAAALAIKYRGSFKWVQDRVDDFLTSNHARDQQYKMSYAVSAEGIIKAIRADILVNIGAYASFPMGSSLEANGGPRNMPGPYDFAQFAFRTRAVATNTCPTGAFRGVSAPSTFFSVEGMMDTIAKELGLDPVELRRRNLVTKFPYTNAMGQRYDTGSNGECLDRALELSGYVAYRRSQPASRLLDGKYRGIGVATVTEQTGQGASRYKERGLYRVPGFDAALIKIEPSGKVSAFVSQAAQGQGHLTTWSQIVAQELGVVPSDVTVIQGDTATVPFGSGTFASRGAILAGGAIIRATKIIRDKVKRIAASVLEASATDIEVADGYAFVAGVPKMRVALSDIASIAYSLDARLIPEGEEHGLEAIAHYDPPTSTVSNATHVAFVAVDPATGAIEVERYVVVHDCGRVINPMIVDGQVHGAISNGLGQVLSEALIYDESGQLTTTTLLDYHLPTALDMPTIQMEHMETPSEITLGGFKGVGEGGVIGAVPALAGAVRDALSPLGIEIIRLPLDPPYVLSMIEAAKAKRTN
ncbi:MAG: xanthine dehydrogenase family protein molybdopterin-binding subunit [Alphaproteobacteria bacterium]|nr:xanthine dehydrogenase family protein molybdopterin-binding subunit [Alphaproteobacteria bacterium]